MKYNTYKASYTHTTSGDSTRRQNTATVVVWGEGEFAVRQGIEHEFPDACDVVIVEMVKQ